MSILVPHVKVSVGFSLGNYIGKSNRLWKNKGKKYNLTPKKSMQPVWSLWESSCLRICLQLPAFISRGLGGGRETCDNWIREDLHVTYDAKAWELHWMGLLRLQPDPSRTAWLSPSFFASLYFSVLPFLEDYISLNRDALGCLWPSWERADEAMHAEKIGAKQWIWEA